MASTARTRNPRGQGERLRAALMDAARELLLELGDQDKLSVRAVTARAGVSPNALYLHFADKDALISAVMIAGYKELRTFLQAAVPPDGGSDRAAPRLQPRLSAVCGATPRDLPRPVHDQGPRGSPDPRARRPLRRRTKASTPSTTSSTSSPAASQTDPTPSRKPPTSGRDCTATPRFARSIPAFPWPAEHDYVDRMIQLHIEAHTTRADAIAS